MNLRFLMQLMQKIIVHKQFYNKKMVSFHIVNFFILLKNVDYM